MKHSVLFALLLFLFYTALAHGADVLLGTVEGGDLLPAPLNCLSYQGHTTLGLALLPLYCIGKTEAWIIVPYTPPSAKWPNGVFMVELWGEVLIFEPIKFAKVRVYRRVKSP